MRSKNPIALTLLVAATVSVGSFASEEEVQRRRTPSRRTVPQRRVVPRDYHTLPRRYDFPVVDVRVGFYYHPYFGFYYGPYYGPFYPYPGPYDGMSRFSSSAVRTKVKPVETEVYVNGYYAGIVDDFDGVFQRLYLPAGEHEIELRLDGYRGFGRKVYLSPGDTFEIKHEMELPQSRGATELPPEPQALPEEWTGGAKLESPSVTEERSASPFGILAIRVQPADAQVLIDGEPWSAMEGLPELAIHLPGGWHQLEIKKEGHNSFATEIELHEGETTRLNVKLSAVSSDEL